jgi:aminoglycoside phosphotransferase family enzyme/predicted kinase
MGEEKDQAEVVAFLADASSYAGVERVDRFETHGNLVFVAGSEAWKIKRAARFPYMDFSTLEKRRVACAREVEVNRRFAPDLYLGCVPITRAAGGRLAFGGSGEIVEWAVHMRRFEQSALLSSLAMAGGITLELARRMADVVFDSHQQADRASAPSGAAKMRQIVRSLCASLVASKVLDGEDLTRFSHAAEDRLGKAAATLDERAGRGFARRCHGDLHLANIVMWHGRPVLYDAIEFDEAIATIDTLYDLAFLLMDLDCRGHRRAANVILNRYLWRSKEDLDLEGIAALPLFLALRAGIRAMVTADRAAQERRQAREQDRESARAYFRAALDYVTPEPPRLVAVAGLSGTGKSTLAAALAPKVGGAPGAVHLRSDLERKALAGIGELQRLPASAYTKEASKRVYEILEHKVSLVLATGHSVVVDAVYARAEERRGIAAIAAALGVPFRGFWLKADPELLISRVAARRNDASDATPEVVQAQLRFEAEALSPAWTMIEAGGAADDTLRSVSSALGLVTAKPQPDELV